jgi:hypothetical protein
MDHSLKQILEVFDRRLGKDEQFYHILDQIGKHIIKLTRLKENEDRPGHFAEEVADMYILGALLMQLEQVDADTLDSCYTHFFNTVDRIYR